MQMIIVCLVLIAASAYILYRAWKALGSTATGNPNCAGCTGCQLSQLKSNMTNAKENGSCKGRKTKEKQRDNKNNSTEKEKIQEKFGR